MTREFAQFVNPIENIWNIMKTEIGNQMLCKKMKRVCEAWYSVPPNVIEELNNSMPRRNADLIIAKGAAKKYCLYDAGVQCCCVFIGMF